MRLSSRLLPLVLLALLSLLPATASQAQWRVVHTPARSGRPPSVAAIVRERADSLAEDADAIQLVLRCEAGRLDGYLTTRDELEFDLSSDVRVRVESDSVRASDSRWQATKANTGAFIPAGDLRDLVQKRLLRAPLVQLSARTMRRGRVTWVFGTQGVGEALESLRAACPTEARGVLAPPPRR